MKKDCHKGCKGVGVGVSHVIHSVIMQYVQ